MKVAIVGAGITGLTAAVELQERGHEVMVLEAAGHPGGAIQSHRLGPWLHEGGPNSILADAGGLTDRLIERAGLSDRVIAADSRAKRRYIVRGTVPLRVPASPLGMATTPLFGAEAKWRLATEPFRHRHHGEADESVADFTRRRLGGEFLDYAIEPLVGGIYAGDPDRLSVASAFPRLAALEREHGSLIVGALRKRSREVGPGGTMLSFPDGLAELPRALVRRLGSAVRLRTRVEGLIPQPAQWTVQMRSADGRARTEDFDCVVCAIPASQLASLRVVGAVDFETPFAALSRVPLPPVVSVFTGFRREQVRHPLDGFGMLVPRREQRAILGTLFSSTLFAGRAPAGHVALTSFVGGTRRPELTLLDDAAIVRTVSGELQQLLGIEGGAVFTSVIRHAQAIPQYELGHAEIVASCCAAECAHPGLFAGGNARDGISVAACIASGRRLAAAAGAYAQIIGAATSPAS